MTKLTKVGLAGVMALAMGAGLARAEDPKPAAPTEKPAAVAAPLTDASLQTLLENMGYQPKIDKLEKTVIYTIEITHAEWTYYVDVSLSDDKDQLWMSCVTADFPKDGKVPAEKLVALLAETNDVGPAAVYHDKKFNKIKVGMALLNHGGITPAVVRTYLGDFANDVAAVQKLCDFPKAGDKADATKTEEQSADKK